MHLVDRLLRQARERLLQLVVGILLIDPAEGRDQQAPAELRILLAHRIAAGAANGRARLARDGDALPGCGRRLALGDQHLDLVAVPELGGERQLAAVDHGADAGIADVGVHGIGEVDRRGAARQGDQAPLGREAEHLVLEQLELGVLEELLGVVAFEQRVDQAPQPDVRVFLVLGTRRAAVDAGTVFGASEAVLVERMRGHAVLGDAMHLVGADLQLDALMARADDGGVDRLVVVLLRRRDVVLEATRHRAPGRVHDAERAVAGVDIAHHDAEAVDVGQLLERDLPVLHLAPDREGLLLAAVHLRRQPGFGELVLQCGADLLDQTGVALVDVVELVEHGLIGRRDCPT